MLLMHACGNPLHDAPIWIAMSLPFLLPAYFWIRYQWARLRKKLSG